jgi:enamine deaminase RidA (YjgF/YER057c/UK114 family)
VDGALPVAGRVGSGGDGVVAPVEAAGLARICALNALAAVQSLIGDLDRITAVIKVVGYVASDPGFTGQPLVINGASEFLGEVFGAAGVHARSAVGVLALPLGAPVEVEMVLAVS